jgi:signal transduction histidine kinase
MLRLSPAYSKDLTILVFISIWFGVLTFVYLHLLPLLILKHQLISLQVAAWLAIAVSFAMFFGIGFFQQVDMDRLLSSGMTFAVLLGILYGVYSGLLISFKRFSPTILDGSAELFLLFMLAGTLVYCPLRRLNQNVVEWLIFSSRPDYQDLLCEFSGRIASSLHLSDLVNVLISELPKQLQITSVGLMIMEEKCSRLYPENLRFGSYLWSESKLFKLLREGHQSFFCRPVTGSPELSCELMEIQKAGFSLVYGLQGTSQFGGMLLLGPRKDGTQYTSRDVQAFSTLANQVIIAVENALNYESLAESNSQLQLVFHKLVQAEKMAALGEMTAMLAHELRNPLGIIRSSAQYLVRGDRKVDTQKKLLNYILDEVDGLNMVINNLLGLARQKPPLFTKVNLGVEIAEFVSNWSSCENHNKKVLIDVSLPEHLPVFYADFRQLRQVLLNCVSNSEEVMPNGGRITLDIRELENERIEIVLSDTGPGVAEDDLKLIFKKFFTTKKKGVGLGLPICRQIVRAHNGSIYLVNRKGGGASVFIRLPLRPLVNIGQNEKANPVSEICCEVEYDG